MEVTSPDGRTLDNKPYFWRSFRQYAMMIFICTTIVYGISVWVGAGTYHEMFIGVFTWMLAGLIGFHHGYGQWPVNHMKMIDDDVKRLHGNPD